MTPESTIQSSPFVGPRAFQAGEPFFGRQREIRDLVDQLIPERLLLLHSPSGAGKTSLIQAGLVPAMREKGFIDLPILRVGLEADLDSDALKAMPPANRYISSLLLALEEGFEQQMPLTELLGLTLDDYLTRRQDELGAGSSLLLIFDQFEEVLTLDPSDLEEKEELFRQLGEALAHPSRWTLFSMREDHVASLAPYLRRLPTRLRTRYRLELLSPAAAKEAIQRPAELAGYAITDEAAIALVDDLRRQRIQRADGQIQETLGAFIEPVQLQVVCARHWKKRGLSARRIDREDLAAVGDVESALRAYYDEIIGDACAGDEVQERTLRRWIEKELISPQSLRTQLLQSIALESFNRRTLEVLIDNHLLRLERRRGIFWLELAHDRLVDPIRAANKAWRLNHQSHLQQQAEFWHQSGRRESLLLRGNALREARRWTRDHPSEELTEPEIELLRHSEEQRRRRGVLVSGLRGAAITFILFFLFLSWQNLQLTASLQQSRSRQLATQALTRVDLSPELASLLSLKSNEIDDTIDSRFSMYGILEENPRLLTNFQLSGMGNSALAFSPAGDQIFTGNASSFYVLDISSGSISDFSPTSQPVLESWSPVVFDDDATELALTPPGTETLEIKEVGSWNLQVKIELPRGIDIRSMAFSPAGDQLLLGGSSSQGPQKFWARRPELIMFSQSEQPATVRWQPSSVSAISSVAFAANGDLFASGTSEGTIHLWNRRTLALEGELRRGHAGPVTALIFHPDGHWLISGGDDWSVRAWDLRTADFLSRLLFRHKAGVTSLALNPRGDVLASGSSDRTVRLWDYTRRSEIATLEGHRNPVLRVAFSPGGHKLATAGVDGQILLWNVEDPHPALGGARSEESILAFDQDGSILNIANRRGSFERWRIQNRSRIGRRSGVAQPHGRQFLFDPIVGSPTHVVASHRVDEGSQVVVKRNGQGIHHLPHQTGEIVTSVAIGKRKANLFTATTDGDLLHWDLGTGHLVDRRSRVHGARICALAASPSSDLLISADVQGSLMLWRSCEKLEKLDEAQSSPGDSGSVGVCRLAVAPGGGILATADYAGTLSFWSLADDRLELNVRIEQAMAEPIDREISSLAFDRHGELLATGGYRDILLWDVEKHRQVGPPLRAHENRVTDLAFSPTAPLLASSSSDRVVLWDLDIEHWRERACRLANRNLTRTEWRQYVGEDVPYEPLCLQFPAPAD